jgi:hypothetical protein
MRLPRTTSFWPPLKSTPLPLLAVKALAAAASAVVEPVVGEVAHGHAVDDQVVGGGADQDADGADPFAVDDQVVEVYAVGVDGDSGAGRGQADLLAPAVDNEVVVRDGRQAGRQDDGAAGGEADDVVLGGAVGGVDGLPQAAMGAVAGAVIRVVGGVDRVGGGLNAGRRDDDQPDHQRQGQDAEEGCCRRPALRRYVAGSPGAVGVIGDTHGLCSFQCGLPP